MAGFIGSLPHGLVRACALSFGGGDEKVVTMHGKRARIPIGGNKSERRLRRCIARCACTTEIEDSHGVERRICDEQVLTVFRLCKRRRIASGVFLCRHAGREVAGASLFACRNRGNLINVGERDIKRLFVRTQQHRSGMRPRSQSDFPVASA